MNPTSKKEAQQVGYRYAFISTLIGIMIAGLILIYLDIGSGGSLVSTLSVLTRYVTTHYILAGITGMFISAYFLGKRAGLRVLNEKSDPYRAGFITGILVLSIGTLTGSITGFFLEGWSYIGINDNPFTDYLLKPFFWIGLFGLIPVIIIGFWYGDRLNEKIKEAGQGPATGPV